MNISHMHKNAVELERHTRNLIKQSSHSLELALRTNGIYSTILRRLDHAVYNKVEIMILKVAVKVASKEKILIKSMLQKWSVEI